MEKLTLKEIAGYLPYDLQILCNSEEEETYISTMVGLHSNGIDDNFGNNWDLEVKPLLYPLEMLTKTIVHNGVEIIPIVELLGHSVLKKHNHSFGYDRGKYYSKFMIENTNEWVYNSIPSDFQSMDYFTIQKLQEWHIDYQNLIPRGLAIDKSTLNSK